MKYFMYIFFITLITASFVYAQYNNCPCTDYQPCSSDMPCNNHNHYGYMNGKRGQAMGEPVIITNEQAKNAVEKHIQNLKGYYIESVESFNKKGYGMTFYRVYVKDSSDNSFFFHVDPWGRVNGPTAYTVTK